MTLKKSDFFFLQKAIDAHECHFSWKGVVVIVIARIVETSMSAN